MLVGLLGLGCYDLVQRRHSVLRNYPVLGHLRFLLEGIRPELQQYFIERNFDGRPYDRDTRSAIYQRAKGEIASYAELFPHLAPGELLGGPTGSWERDWVLADPDRFRP